MEGMRRTSQPAHGDERRPDESQLHIRAKRVVRHSEAKDTSRSEDHCRKRESESQNDTSLHFHASPTMLLSPARGCRTGKQHAENEATTVSRVARSTTVDYTSSDVIP
uniref:Uncharacterized protein n=1 Tax=Mycena chlorophos TaxID=658473 RepID=A0ABQ0M2H8_MYCCL|nr:predicted protein [Mycena chlorophos]